MSSDQYEELATELDTVESAALDDRRAAQIRFFSRLGFWGVVVGMAPVAVDVLVDTWVWQVESIVTPVGVLVGGVGTLVASTLVFREVSASRKPIKWAAMAGIPLGLTLTALSTLYLFIEPTELLVSVFDLGVKAALVLGISLVVLLVAGFVTQPGDAAIPDDEFG